MMMQILNSAAEFGYARRIVEPVLTCLTYVYSQWRRSLYNEAYEVIIEHVLIVLRAVSLPYMYSVQIFHYMLAKRWVLKMGT